MITKEIALEIERRYLAGERLKDLLIEYKTSYFVYDNALDFYSLRFSNTCENNIRILSKIETKIWSLAREINSLSINEVDKAVKEKEFNELNYIYTHALVTSPIGITNEQLK